jgi:hypothetical protein
MLSKTWTAIAVALILPFLHGCGNDDANKGEVRIVNATTEYASLDLYTRDSDGNDNLVVSGAATGAASAYTGVDKGSYTFDIKSASGPSVAASAAGTVNKTDHYSVVTYLTGNSLQAQYLSDEETNPSSGNAKLRVFNAASSEASSVDVYLTTNLCNALGVTDTAFSAAVTGLQTSYSQVTAATAGTDWHVCVTTAGDKGSLLLDIPKLTLKNQEIATLILTHTSGGVLLNASVLDQQGALTAYANTIARLRVVSDAALTASVSVSVNGVALVAGSPSPSVGDYQTVAVGTLNASVTIGSSSAAAFALPAAVAGTDYTLLVTGDQSNPAAVLLTDVNTPSTSTTQTVRVRVVNGVNSGNGSVSGTIDGKLIGTAAFGAASGYTTIVPTTGTSTVRGTTNGTNPADLVNQSFVAGSVYTIFIYGDASQPKMDISVDR